MEDLDLIEQYLKDSLSPSEKQEIEARIENDADFKSLLEKTKISLEAIKLQSIKEEVIKAQKAYLSSEEKKVFSLFKPFRIAAAVAFLVLAWSSFNLAKYNPNSFFEENSMQYESPIMRSTESEELQIEKLYQSKKYKEVIVTEIHSEKTGKEIFLIAMANYNLKNFDLCLVNLIKLKKLDSKMYPFENEYYTAMSLMGIKKYKEAIEAFENIQKNVDSPYSKKIGFWFMVKIKILAYKSSF